MTGALATTKRVSVHNRHHVHHRAAEFLMAGQRVVSFLLRRIVVSIYFSFEDAHAADIFARAPLLQYSAGTSVAELRLSWGWPLSTASGENQPVVGTETKPPISYFHPLRIILSQSQKLNVSKQFFLTSKSKLCGQLPYILSCFFKYQRKIKNWKPLSFFPPTLGLVYETSFPFPPICGVLAGTP